MLLQMLAKPKNLAIYHLASIKCKQKKSLVTPRYRYQFCESSQFTLQLLKATEKQIEILQSDNYEYLFSDQCETRFILDIFVFYITQISEIGIAKLLIKF